jgi:nucleoside-diphosphate-sugar epimerase
MNSYKIYNMAHILVTGAQGFVGQRLVPKLLEIGHTITAVDQIFYEPPLGSDCVSIQTHIEDSLFLTDNDIQKCETVIHLANTSRIEPSWSVPGEYYRNNISVTTDFFRRCQRLGVKRFYHFSSSSVYGDNGKKIQHEDSPLSPVSPYAISKAAGENSLRSFAHNTELVTIRPFTMYGETMPLDKNALAIGKFIRAWSRDEPLIIHNGGKQVRDFIYVDEAVSAVLLLLDKAKPFEVYNIGYGHSYSIKEIADIISNQQIHSIGRPGTEYNVRADVSKLERLGFRATVDVCQWLITHKEKLFKEFICL